MGAWGEGPFDNDTAADWVEELDDADRETGLELLRAALRTAADTPADEYLDSDDGAQAVAAAEVVAAARGTDVEASPYNETALGWIARTRPAVDAETVALAARALERVAAPESELAELWDEAGDPAWREGVDRRVASLRAPG